MKAEDLKASILQAAVQGKLVPQDSNDEPASVLVERIREEKRRLIREKRIKADKNESHIYRRDGHWYETINGKNETCIDEEIPFDLPEAWCWIRLKNISKKITDGTHHSPPNQDIGDFMYISAKNIKDSGVDLSNVTYVSSTIHKEIYSRCDPEYGDILLVKDGATTGTITINNIQDQFSLLSSVALIKLLDEINSRLFVWFIRSPGVYNNMRQNMTGTGITRLTLSIIESGLIPIAPILEQERIVHKIEELMPLVEQYDEFEKELTDLEHSFPTDLRASVLQAAVQGKLVPQDPNDEPASALIERIREEKRRLIREKKIKAEKNESHIYRRDGHWYETVNGKDEKCIDNEIPFDIPDNWTFCRLGAISNFGKNESFKLCDIPSDATILELEDIEKNSGQIIGIHKKEGNSESSTRAQFFSGDVLYGKLRPYLNKVVIPDFDGYCSSEIFVLKFSKCIINTYAQKTLMSPYFVEYATEHSHGVKMPRIGTDEGKAALIPIPPITEQKRIVQKIEELMKLIKPFESLINQS